MPRPPTEPPSSDGINVGNVGGNVSIRADGDIIGRDKITQNYYSAPIQLRAQLRHGFDLLIKRLTRVFAGRKAELARISEFIHDGGGGYLIVTAPAGFGKSALMASLIAPTPEAFAYHFFTPDPQTLNRQFFLRNVVEQLAKHFSKDGQLPTDEDSLGALLQKYMGLEPSRSVVLILDGLHEVRWDPDDSTGGLRRYLGQELPKGLSIILTVRETGQDWAKDLDLSTATLQSIRLGALSTEEVREGFQAAGSAGAQVAADEQLFGDAMRITAYQGDQEQAYPPLVRWLLSDIADGRLLPDSLRDRLSGFDPYLDELWKTLRGIAKDDDATGDFIGTLAAALGPMRQEELQIVNPSLVAGLAGDAFEQEVLPAVRRFVFGDQERGYMFAPAPFRDHVRQRMSRTLRTYQERLIAFCSDWRQNGSAYALEHYAAHLAERSQVEQCREALFRLVDNEDWYRGRSKRDPSHAAFLGDLHFAWSVAAAADEEAVRAGRPATLLARKLRWSLVTASLRTVMRSIRSRLLAAMVKAQVLSPAQAISIVINRVALIESQDGQYLPVARAMEALAPILPHEELTTAAKAMQEVPDHDARAKALHAIAQHVPASVASGLILDALRAARAIDDDGTRAETLALLVPSLPTAESKSVVDEAAEAARSADPEGRIEILLAVAGVAESDLRQELLQEARKSAADILEPKDRVEALCALAPVLEPSEGTSVLKDARAAAILIEDPSEQVRMFSELCGLIPPAERGSLVEETLDHARKLPQAESAEQISGLLAHFPNERQSALFQEIMAIADGVQSESDKFWGLLGIAEKVPPSYRDSVLARAERVARAIRDNVQQDRLLVEVALASDTEAQRKLLTEIANRRPGDLGTKNLDREEREVAELFAFLARHAVSAEQGTLIAEALAAARAEGYRQYDKALAYVALLPTLPAPEQVALVREARALARALEKPFEKAEVLIALVPLVPPSQAEDAAQEALLAVRAAPISGGPLREATFDIDEEEGIVAINRGGWKNPRRGRLLVLLACCGFEEQRQSILRETVASLEEMESYDQAETLAGIAPLLNEASVVDLLGRLHRTEANPLRLEMIAATFKRLVEVDSLEAARKQAYEIWGENVPGPVEKVLTEESRSKDSSCSAEDAAIHVPTSISGAEDGSAVTATIENLDISDLCRLTAPPVVRFGSSKLREENAEEAEFARELTRNFAADTVSKLGAEDTREILNGILEFHDAELWREARTALVLRLVELGAVEKACAEANAFWPEEPKPVQVLCAFAQASPSKSDELLAKEGLPAALKIQNPRQRVTCLAQLLPYVREQDRPKLFSEMEKAASVLLGDSNIDEVDPELLQLLFKLPRVNLLSVWDHVIGKLAAGRRKEILIALPSLLLLGEKLSQETFWSEATAAIRTVRRQWP